LSTPYFQLFLVVFAGWVNRGQQDVIQYLQTENRILREQLRGRRVRFSDAQRRSLAETAKRIGRKGLFGIGTVVTPDTLLRWYRQLVARKYDGNCGRGIGRPKTVAEIERLVVTMARANPGWGYTRIRGALYNLAHEIGRNTIKRILHEHGLEPAPERGKKTSWETFLKSHWAAIAATEFFSVEVLTPRGLVRHLVLFVIDLQTRTVEISGIVRQPDGDWMKQVARNLTDAGEGFLRDARYLIHDRDSLFSRDFCGILRGAGVEIVRLPARSPNLNAYAERFVRSIKSECLAKIIPLGENHLRLLVSEFVEHYHLERNHQGLGNQLIERSRGQPPDVGRVKRRERLGGVLNFYYREAA
jgi:putative transposase